MNYRQAQFEYDSREPEEYQGEQMDAYFSRIDREEAILGKDLDEALAAVLEYLKVVPEIEEALDALTLIVDHGITAPFRDRHSPIKIFVAMALRYKATKIVDDVYGKPDSL